MTLKAIKSFENVDRKAIQEATWEKHNKEAWKKQFENCVDKTIENFKVNQTMSKTKRIDSIFSFRRYIIQWLKNLIKTKT